jgi:hypothetical protein
VTAVALHGSRPRCASHWAQLLLSGACWFASTVTAGAVWEPAREGWLFIRRVDNVDLYRRPVQDSDIPALLGHVRFAATSSDVFRVISDYNHFAEFIPLVSESRVLERNARTTWVYQRIGLPLLLADRHYVIKVTDDLPDVATGVITVGWQLDKSRSRSLSSGHALLPAAFSGYWHLAALPDQAGCDAVYSVHVEPGGAVPAWLFARASEHYVVQVINAVRKRIAVGRPW